MKVTKTQIEHEGKSKSVITLGNVNPGRSGLTVTLEETLWLTADRSEAVADGDERAAYLLGREGMTIPIEQAKELGLDVDDSDLSSDNDEDKAKKKEAGKNKQAKSGNDK